MADIRDWGKFVRGRWDWTRCGYEKGFPRGCQFTDVDAAVEFDGCGLVIEPKHYDGIGPLSGLETGQALFLRNEVALGKTVFVLFGCGPCNDPHAVVHLAHNKAGDKIYDWRGLAKEERRKRLKRLIDVAMGVTNRDKAAA